MIINFINYHWHGSRRLWKQTLRLKWYQPRLRSFLRKAVISSSQNWPCERGYMQRKTSVELFSDLILLLLLLNLICSIFLSISYPEKKQAHTRREPLAKILHLKECLLAAASFQLSRPVFHSNNQVILPSSMQWARLTIPWDTALLQSRITGNSQRCMLVKCSLAQQLLMAKLPHTCMARLKECMDILQCNRSRWIAQNSRNYSPMLTLMS